MCFTKSLKKCVMVVQEEESARNSLEAMYMNMYFPRTGVL